jgi:multidrug efflux system membrane fusion protein
MKPRRWWMWVLAAVVLAVVAGVVHTRTSRAPARADARTSSKPAAVPVAVASVGTRDVARYLGGLGAVTALNTVTVKSRVDGQLMTVRFQEGQLARRGDLLAEMAAISAVPARAHANLEDAFVVQDRAVTASAVDDNQAASSCEHDGGWYDAAAGVCDSVGE